jgi:LysM repeat protein
MLSILFVSSISGVVGAESGGGIGGKPANPDPRNSRTSTIFIKTIEPGTGAEDEVEIINNYSESKTIQIYAVDSIKSSGGAFACAQAADEIKGAGSWIKLDKSEIRMDAGQKLRVGFNISVPKGSDVGEHNACVVMQEKKDATTQAGVGLNFRTAIRVAVLVPGDIVKSIRPTGISVTTNKDKLSVIPRVKSESNVSLDVLMATRLRPLFLGKGQSKETTFPVLRSEEAEWNFEFNKPFWGGFYTASYDVSYNSDTRLSLGEDSAASKTTVAGPNKRVFVWPNPLALLIEVLVSLIVILLLVIVPRRFMWRHKVNKKWQSYEVKSGETLEIVAKKLGIKWKKLAKANHIKAPYTVMVGSVIKVPGNRKGPLNDDVESEAYSIKEMPTNDIKPETEPNDNELANDEAEEEDIIKELNKDASTKKKSRKKAQKKK